MAKMKATMNQHYEANMKQRFYKEIVNSLNGKEDTRNIDWESTFFIWHRPESNINKLPYLSVDFKSSYKFCIQIPMSTTSETIAICKDQKLILNKETMREYMDQLIKLAENLSEVMSENLGLEKNYIMQAFSGSKGPSVGTKVAKYPRCPYPEQVKGLREHTDAGGIILLLQDDEVPGFEFFKNGQLVEIPPSKNNRIFVNTGDQLEVLSNGRYKSALHRVMADKKGSRLSVATFYNPAGDAIISPASKLLYPEGFCFQDYLEIYGETKFADKVPRFESTKKLTSAPQKLLV